MVEQVGEAEPFVERSGRGVVMLGSYTRAVVVALGQHRPHQRSPETPALVFGGDGEFRHEERADDLPR